MVVGMVGQTVDLWDGLMVASLAVRKAALKDVKWVAMKAELMVAVMVAVRVAMRVALMVDLLGDLKAAL